MSLEALSKNQFEVILVTKKTSIRNFVEDNGISFKKGSGYYQLLKPETIQDYKKIVAQRNADGEFVSGEKIREILEIPADASKFRLDTSKLPDFKIFVQSTSYTRVLHPNSWFLYETGSAPDVAPTHAGLPPPPPFHGAGGPIEIVFSFDTTGSMSSCLNAVRTNLQELIQRLYTDIPTLRMSVFAHGDYCDKHNYVTKFIDFTTDVDKLCNFVKNVASTGGGDYPEAYELVLREVREKLSWSPNTQRALVMIGDAIPHEPSFPENKLKIDWKVEVDQLIREMGVRIYGVQCSTNTDSTKFFKHMATQTHGHHLHLDNFKNIQDFIMAICYREHGDEYLQAYHSEVVTREGDSGLNSELHRLFDTLKAPTAVVSPLSPPTTPPTTIKTKPADTPVKTAKGLKTATKDTVKKRLFKIADPKKVKRVAKKSKVSSRRVAREKVGHGNNFAFKHLRWSPWKLAVMQKWSGLDENWEAVSRNVIYNKSLFNQNFRYAAAYEIAIQEKHSLTKSVVYLRSVQGFSRGENWFKHLLASRSIQVRKAVRAGCLMYVRRCYVVPKATETVKQGVKSMRSKLVRTYDYAWNTSEYGRNSVRRV